MHALYLISVGIHILAATIWIGGMFFLVLVLVPWLRKGTRPDAVLVVRETGERFRGVSWACFVALMLTGTFNLWVRGVRLTDFVSAEWLASPFGRTVLFKLGVFVLVLGLSAMHDFVIGPRATQVLLRAPGSPEAKTMRRRASLMGRLNVALALMLLVAGVLLVRGTPW